MEPEPNEPQHNDKQREVDQWLDAALSQSAKVEPRDGLEGRVLANLQIERNKIALRRRWWWAAGTVAATAAIALAVWLGRGERPRTIHGVSTTARHENGSGNDRAISPEIRSATQSRPPAELLARKPLRNPSPQPQSHAPELAHAAKFERFPAPTPLSEQEKLLARYVRQFPQEAALIASAQSDLEEHNQLEMAAPWPKQADQKGLEQQQ